MSHVYKMTIRYHHAGSLLVNGSDHCMCCNGMEITGIEITVCHLACHADNS